MAEPYSAGAGRRKALARCIAALGVLVGAVGVGGAAGGEGGYGRFEWGASIGAVRAVEPKATVYAEAEPVRVEGEAFARVAAAERRAAAAKGKAALRGFAAKKRPAARLAALRYWVELAGLPGRVELRFFDGQLYEAVVRVLYRASEKPAAGQILDALVAKYGAPLDPPVGQAPPEERPRLDFALPGGGTLRVMKRAVEGPRSRGMLRLHYRAPGADAVAGYLDALAAQAAAAEVAARAAPGGERGPTGGRSGGPAGEAGADPTARDALWQHL